MLFRSLESTEGEEEYQEGCISYPGLFLKVKRSKSIKVRFTDMYGLTKEQRFDGLTARIFQHELDHLNGVLFTSKVSKTSLDRARDKVKKNIKQIERAEYEAEIIRKIRETQKSLESKSKILDQATADLKSKKAEDFTGNLMKQAEKLAPLVPKEAPTTFEYKTS